MSEPIRILIADDHPIVRRGLRTLITSEPGLELLDEATNGVEAVEKARLLRPDVILLDLVMPHKDGLEALIEIKKEDPEARILILTSFAEDDRIFSAVKAGALGYLLKDTSPEELLEAIRNVYQGEPSLPPAIARKLILEINRPPPDLPPAEQPLTEREVDILKLIAQGLTNQEIAAELVISEWTVRTHVRNILGKLHLANRTQAALYALRTGLADLEQTDI
jgi:NarL family two-component system response regulator LiaR